MDLYFDLLLPALDWCKTQVKSLSSQEAILVSAILATMGWTRSNKMTRKLDRKQHTMSVMLKDDVLQKGLKVIRPYVKKNCYPSPESDERQAWQDGLRQCLNYYEFLCVGILEKDFDEKMVRKSERYTLTTLYRYAEGYIDDLRTIRPHGVQTADRSQIYVGIEKIVERWNKQPWLTWQ